MYTQMLRKEIDELKRKNKLKVCNIPVDSKFEIGAVLRYYQNQVPILFNEVKGYNMPLIGGLHGNRDLYYEFLNTSKDTRINDILNAITNPVKPKLVDYGPVMENIITENINIQKMFPVPISHEKDSSSYITAGMFVIKDTETRKTHIAVRRFQVNEGNSISAYVSPASPRLMDQMRNIEMSGKPMECAVVLGYDAAFLLASQISSAKYGVDKYEVDSSLRGEPLELVKCRTVDLEVPAQAEIVLEGIIPPNKRIKEGPFGELMSYYGGVSLHPIIEVRAIMCRNNPIFLHAFPCREEHLANGLIREAEIYAMLKNIVDVQDVNVTVGGGYRLHAIISIKKKDPGDGVSAILSALGSNKDLKHVVIVDDDVNIYDYKDVEFALATRVQASKDVIIVPDALGSALEASHVYKKTTDKVGIDATKPLGAGNEIFERVKIPGYEEIKDVGKYFR